jgi:hypothetical protein
LEEAVEWLRRNGKPIKPGRQADWCKAIHAIAGALQLKGEMDYSWTCVKNPVDKQLANCFFVGANHDAGGLNRAKDWEWIRRFQRVLGIDEDVFAFLG